MARFALWLAQMPGSVPDLIWWILGGAAALLNISVGLAVRLAWVHFDDRLKRLERWQEDHSP